MLFITGSLNKKFQLRSFEVSKVVQQVEQGQTFDFGGLTELMVVTQEQLLTETGLDVKLADITQRLAAFTVEVPTQFEGMSGEDLQSVQAESQLLEEGLTDQVVALTDLLTYFSSKPHKYEFESITEIAQLFSKQTQISLFSILEEVAELALRLERRALLNLLSSLI